MDYKCVFEYILNIEYIYTSIIAFSCDNIFIVSDVVHCIYQNPYVCIFINGCLCDINYDIHFTIALVYTFVVHGRFYIVFSFILEYVIANPYNVTVTARNLFAFTVTMICVIGFEIVSAKN